MPTSAEDDLELGLAAGKNKVVANLSDPLDGRPSAQAPGQSGSPAQPARD